MKSADDIENAISTLKRLRVSAVADAKKELAELVQKIRDTKGAQQAEVFVAVQRVRKTLEERPDSAGLPALWDDAIAKAEDWRWLLRRRAEVIG